MTQMRQSEALPLPFTQGGAQGTWQLCMMKAVQLIVKVKRVFCEPSQFPGTADLDASDCHFHHDLKDRSWMIPSMQTEKNTSRLRGHGPHQQHLVYFSSLVNNAAELLNKELPQLTKFCALILCQGQ